MQQFESEAAPYTGARFAVAVNSGTAALQTDPLPLGIGRDDDDVSSRRSRSRRRPAPPCRSARGPRSSIYRGTRTRRIPPASRSGWRRGRGPPCRAPIRWGGGPYGRDRRDGQEARRARDRGRRAGARIDARRQACRHARRRGMLWLVLRKGGHVGRRGRVRRDGQAPPLRPHAGGAQPRHAARQRRAHAGAEPAHARDGSGRGARAAGKDAALFGGERSAAPRREGPAGAH